MPPKIPYRYGPMDDDGIPMFDPKRVGISGSLSYHPVAIIQYALANFTLALEGDKKAETIFLRCSNWLETHAELEPQRRFVTWYYHFSLRTPPLKPPWMSGMAQGQALSLLARSYQQNNSERTLDTMRQTSRAFLYTVDEGGMITRFKDSTCFIEEIAHRPSLQILNGCLFGLLGLLEYINIDPDHDLQLDEVAGACLDGVEKRLDDFDTGYWSRYSLGLRGNLTDRKYHTIHIHQLRYLGKKYNRLSYIQRAEQWQSYLTSYEKIMKFHIYNFFMKNTWRALKLLGLGRFRYRDTY